MRIERAIEILDPEHSEHYESIEPVNEACRMGMKALEKQIPKRPRVDDDSWYCCPRCDETFFMWDKLSRRLLYCGNCGQKLDWSKADAQKRSDTNDR